MDNEKYEFFSSGCTLLDLVLGGGWALQHIFNIVGDKSTGKTLLAIEGMANFKRKFPKGRMRYGESEASFDPEFARTLGFPDDVELPEDPLNTVEDFEADFRQFIKKEEGPSLYILDSLDALSDEAEMERWEENIKARAAGKEEKGTYGATKPKKMSEFFRKLVRETRDNNACLGIISQIRDNIGVTFGETKTRSGGKALDFYASQVLWLADLGKNTRTSKGETRPVGVNIRARCKKLKVGMPFRECDFPIIFGYGIDDEAAMLQWLTHLKQYEKETVKEIEKKLDKARTTKDYATIDEVKAILQTDTIRVWNEIERNLAPTITKYHEKQTPQPAK
jgi:recombination protein RecA